MDGFTWALGRCHPRGLVTGARGARHGGRNAVAHGCGCSSATCSVPMPELSCPARGAVHWPQPCQPWPCQPVALTACPAAQRCWRLATLGARQARCLAPGPESTAPRREDARWEQPPVLAARAAHPPSLCRGKSRPHRHCAEVIAGYYSALLLNTDHFSSDKPSV